MTSSSQKHHAGTKINSKQMEQMIKSYQNGETNSGKQEVECPEE
jgi:hypothetical protein